jgi:hypothetical protein
MFNKTTFERRHNNENFDVAKHFTFILHDMVFVAVNDNAYVLHDIPPETYLSSRDIGDGRTVMWGLNDFIWLGYTLQNPRYEGRLLGRLSTIKIVQIGEEYTLAPGIRDSWQLLQTHLLEIYQILFRTSTVEMLVPNHYCSPPFPSAYGFPRQYRTHKAALRSSHQSRHAFNLLMAAVSFTIMMHLPEKDPSNSNPSWARKLEEHGVHPDYIQLVKESAIADFNPENKRVGCILSWKTQWLNLVPRMEAANVPFWIYFGDFTNRDPYSDSTSRSTVGKYTPTSEDINTAMIEASRRPLKTTEFRENAPASNVGAQSSSTSGQNPPLRNAADTVSSWGQDASSSSWGQGASSSSSWGQGASSSSWGQGASSLSWGQETSSSSWGEGISSLWDNNESTPWDMPEPVALGASQLPQVADVTMHHTDPAVPPQSNQTFRPPPERQSRQLPDETWQQFFAREEKIQQRRLANASEARKQKWASRQLSSQSQKVPGRSGPRVYIWEEDDEFPGFLYRKYVNREVVDSIWDEFSSTTRRFNKFENEWDLCHDFDPTAPSDADLFNEMFDPEDGIMHPPYQGDMPLPGPPPPSPPPSIPQSPAAPNFELDLVKTYDDDNDIQTTTVRLRLLGDLLRTHYGFLFDDDDDQPYPPPTSGLSWPKATAALLHPLTESGDDIQSQNIRNAVCDFVSHMVTSASTIPPLLWDLNLYSHHPLYMHRESRISVQTVAQDDKTYFILRPSTASNHSPWLVVTWSAATVLDCMRHNWPPGGLTCVDLALYLFQHGMRFSMRSLTPPILSSPRPVPQFEALGWRRKTHKFTYIDYQSYNSRLLEFFRRPHSRAALEMEGIVWRLSRAVLDQDTVLLGPALEDGCTDVLSCDDLNLWGDKLSDHDLDLICGVYKVEGKSGMSFIYQDFSLT